MELGFKPGLSELKVILLSTTLISSCLRTRKQDFVIVIAPTLFFFLPCVFWADHKTQRYVHEECSLHILTHWKLYVVISVDVGTLTTYQNFVFHFYELREKTQKLARVATGKEASGNFLKLKLKYLVFQVRIQLTPIYFSSVKKVQ